jgi:hypothetical protein
MRLDLGERAALWPPAELAPQLTEIVVDGHAAITRSTALANVLHSPRCAASAARPPLRIE